MLEATETKAAAIIERCKYELTGYVLTCPTRQTKAIVDLASTRWFPDPADFARVMVWKDPKGPGTPEEGFELEAAAVPVPLVAPAAASRPVLTAPPSAKLLESTEAALGALARELGCAFNDEIPHNAGWFVPGKATAHASAYDAIRGLFASLEAGGTVYRAPAAAVEVQQLEAPAPKADEPQLELAQGALF